MNQKQTVRSLAKRTEGMNSQNFGMMFEDKHYFMKENAGKSRRFD